MGVDEQRRIRAAGETVCERSGEHDDEQQLGHAAMLRPQGKERLNLLGGVERRHRLRGLDLGSLRFHQPHDMVDHVGVLHMVIGHA